MRVGLYLNLGMVWNLMKDVDHSVEYIQRSLEIAEENGLFSDLHRAHYYLGCIHQADGQFTDAIHRFQLAHESAGRAKLPSEQSESLTSLGEVYLMLGEFANAKVYLQKALSLVPPTHREHNTIRKHLRRAMKGIELQESLSTLPPDHHRGTMRIYEKLGDLCCKVTGYQRGLEYYQKQLACADTLKLPDEERAMIYFSLGSTYFDLKDYKQAISHYETELTFQEDRPREKCKTWLHLAAAKEMDGTGSIEVDRCYQNALQLAKESNDPRLQRKVLKEQARSHGETCSSSEQDRNDGTASDSSSQETPETEDPELPGPSDPELPGPSDPELPGPSDRELPGPSDRELPGPSDPELPGPSDPELPGPSDRELPGPSDRELPGPSDPELPGPSDPELPGPSDPELQKTKKVKCSLSKRRQTRKRVEELRLPQTLKGQHIKATVKTNQKWKRNLKGESPLHRACITGSWQQAHSLIAMGHPLTVRDNAGWTPLHEACNNGHVEIVQMLLDSGAPVNSVDDKLCGGVTTLHDALQAGHLEIAELLIDRGANLTVQDFSGRSPADCFNQWSRSIKQEPSPESRLQWESVSHILETGTPQHHPHLDTATQTAIGPELKPFSQRRQHSHSDVFVSEYSQLSSCSPSPDSTMTSCLQEQDGGHSTGAKLPQPSPTPTTQRSHKSLQNRKIQSSVGHKATTASLFSSTSNSFISDESNDFMPSLIPFKKQHIHEGQSSASDHTYFTQSFMSTTTSSKTTQSSANTKKSSIKTTQSRKRSRKPLSKSVQSRMGSKKSSSKSVQSRKGSEKSSPNRVQSSVGLEESTSKHVQPSESSTPNLLVDQSQSPVVTNTAANGGQPPAVGSDWLDSNCSDDDWLEVDRSSRTQALSQPAQAVTVPVVGGSQNSSLRPGQDNAHRYSAKTAHAPTPSSLSHPGKDTMARIPSSFRVSRPSTSQPSGPSTPRPNPSFRVKVKVKKECFVIGIPPSELDTYTISWLAGEAGRKYDIECGLRPQLSLTLDGALLSPHEPIVHLLRDNEVVSVTTTRVC
ncbi:tonsoku-like protein [Chiloscyllium punctatum]|uniref:tonsoku-like protein n=1 Tax=Chiloscyllium punctatum TaxID=137246 RepID=UPI003B638A66